MLRCEKENTYFLAVRTLNCNKMTHKHYLSKWFRTSIVHSRCQTFESITTELQTSCGSDYLQNEAQRVSRHGIFKAEQLHPKYTSLKAMLSVGCRGVTGLDTCKDAFSKVTEGLAVDCIVQNVKIGGEGLCCKVVFQQPCLVP